jgi:hypothetical protein
LKEHHDEKGDLVAIETNVSEPVEIPPAQLRYISPCPDPRFVADLCIVDQGRDYIRFAINRDQALNMLEALTKLLRNFDKRTPEDTYNG